MQQEHKVMESHGQHCNKNQCNSNTQINGMTINETAMAINEIAMKSDELAIKSMKSQKSEMGSQ